MPTVSIQYEDFTRLFGSCFSIDDIDKLCFDYGLELDDVVTETDGSKTLKIEVGANRHDLLSAIGITRALRVFTCREKQTSQLFQTQPSEKNKFEVDEMKLKQVRPCGVAAVVRDLDIQDKEFQWLIDIQEKLHQNLGRRRALVSIGVHDLDKIEGPNFRYTTMPVNEIEFVPLTSLDGKTKVKGRQALLSHYNDNIHLRPYIPLVQNLDNWAVIMDAKGDILSQPPVINSMKSKVVAGQTRNLLIEITGMDNHRCKMAMEALVYQIPGLTKKTKIIPLHNFSRQFVNVTYEHAELCNSLPPHQWPHPEELCGFLTRMGYHDTRVSENKIPNSRGVEITFKIPPNRLDVMHLCDVREDVAIAFGYSNISDKVQQPVTSGGRQLPIGMLSEMIREELARCGFSEGLTFALCPLGVDPGSPKASAVIVSNPRCSDFSAVRQSLWPGLTRTMASNQHVPLPICLFEVSDVVGRSGVEVEQKRNVAVLYAGKQSSGFEHVHGTLDRLVHMIMGSSGKQYDLRLNPKKCADYFLPGRGAQVLLKTASSSSLEEEFVIGEMGVIHPDVLKLYSLRFPCSMFEINVDAILKRLHEK